jgi:hypothetical protein
VWVAGEFLLTNRTTEPFWYTELATLPPASTCSGGPVLLSNVFLAFGSQPQNVQSSPIVVTITNNQSTTLTIDGISTGGGNFTQTNTCQQPLAAQGTCTVSVYFTPQSAGTLTGQLTITDSASNSPQYVALTGIGATASLTLSASSLSFGSQVINTTTAGQGVTVTNNGAANVTINSIQASGGFGETDNCSGTTLTPAQTCTVTVTFTPSSAGATTGTVTLNDTAAGTPQLVSLTGTGLLPVSMSANLTFAATNVGTTSTAQTMTMNNNQSTTLTFTYTTSGDFAATGNGTTPCNGSLAANSKCTFGVTFTPTENGTIKGGLTISYSGAGSPVSGGLTGTGQNGATAPLTFTPASLSYGNVAMGTTSAKSVTIKNGGTTSLTISSVTGSGPYTVAPSGTTPCPATLAAGKSCTVTVTFAPQVSGTIIGGITVLDNASVSTQIMNATGVGVLPVTLSPSSVSFGSVNVGSTSAVTVITVTNNELVAIPINSIVASGDFIYTTGGGVPCGTTVPTNSICTIGVEFSPTTTGSISGDLTLSFAAGDSPQVVSLTGTGAN